VEVPPHEGSANPGIAREKSDRSADASGAISQASFSLPKMAITEIHLVTGGTRLAV